MGTTARIRIAAAALLCMAVVPARLVAADGVLTWIYMGTGNFDTSVGLSASKTYVSAVNVGGAAVTINGVSFAAATTGNPSGTGFTTTGMPNPLSNDQSAVTGQLGTLLDSFDYGGSPQTVTLNNLAAGQTYTLTFYNRQWDATGPARGQTATTTSGASLFFYESPAGGAQNSLNMLRYTFTATGTAETITFTLQSPTFTFHNSGFSTEQVFNNAWVSGTDWTTATWSVGQPNAVGANADFGAQASPTTMNLDAGRTVGNIRFSGANAWTLVGSSTLTLAADVGAYAVLSSSNGVHEIAAPTAWSSSVFKTGAGTLVLSGSAATNGNTLLLGSGMLSLGGGGAIGSSGTISFGGGTLQFSAANTTDYSGRFDTSAGQAYLFDTNGQTVTFGSNLASSGGTLTKLGSGTLALAGINTFTGTTRAVAGVLAIASTNALQNSLLDMNVADAGTLSFGQDSTLGGLTGSRSLDMSGRTLAVGNNNQSTTYGGTLSSGGLTKLGTGTLTLSGSNAYTGTTTISAGVLQIGGGGTSGALAGGSAITGSAGTTLVFSRIDDYGGPVANAIGGGINLTLSSGSLTLSGSNTFSGTTRITAGALTVGNANALRNSMLDMNAADSGTIAFSQDSTLGGLMGTRTLALGGRTVSVGANNASTTYSGTLSNGALGKVGTGTLTLSGSNTYSGGTTINGGTVISAISASAGGTSPLGTATIANVITINSGTLTGSTNNNNWLDNTSISSGGVNAHAVVVNPAGTLKGATNAITGLGNVALNGGTIEVVNGYAAGYWNGAFTLAGDITVSGSVASRITTSSGAGGGANIQMSNGGNNVNGTRTFIVNDVTGNSQSDLVVTARLANGTVVKTGAGTLELASGMAGTGTPVNWQVSVGTLLTTWTNAIGAGTVTVASAGTLDVGGQSGLAVGGITLAGSLLNSSTTAAASTSGNVDLGGAATASIGGAGNLTLSGSLSNGGFTKVGPGTLTLSAVNTFGGSTRVAAGLLSLTNANALQGSTLDMNAADSGTVAFNQDSTLGGLLGSRDLDMGGRTLDIGANGQSTIYSGTLSSGALTKLGGGTLTLTAASTYTGTTNVSAGTLAITSTTFASPTVNVAGGAALSGTATLNAVTVANAGILTPGVAGVGTLTLSSLAFSGSGTVNVGVRGVATSSLLQVNGALTADGGPNSVAFAFGSGLAALGSGTYTLISYTGSQLGDVSAFTVSGTTGARQTVSVANGTQAVTLVSSNASLVWSGTAGSDWSATDNWLLSTTGSATSFLASDAVVFDDSGSTGGVTLSQNVDPAALTFSGSTLAYTLSGSGGFGVTTGVLAKSGPATLTVSTSNSYAGGTSLSAGTLRIGDNAALGTGVVTVAGGTLSSDGAAARTLANAFTFGGDATLGSATATGALTLAGAVDLGGAMRTLSTPSGVTLSGAVANGGLAKSGAGTLTLSGSNALTAGTQLNAGVLALGSAGALGPSGVIAFAGGTLQFSAANTTDYSGRFSAAAGQAYALDTNGQTVTLATALTSAGGSLTKLGAGTLALSGSNSYTGATTVSAGVLQVGVSGTGASLTIPNFSFETPNSGNFTYTPSGASWTFNAQAGIAQNTFFSTTPPAGIQAAFIQQSGSFFQSITTGTAGFYRISFQAQGRGGTAGPNGLIVQVDGTTAGTWAANEISQSQWLTYSSMVYLTTGTHTLAFLGNNTLGGDRSTSIDNVWAAQPTSQGTLSPTSPVTLAASGATLDLNGTRQTVNSLSGVAGSSVVRGYLTTGGDGVSTTFAGSLLTVNLAKVGSGTLTLTGSNTLIETTTVSAGVLQIGGGGTAGSLNAASPVSVSAGATLAFNRSDALTYGGTVSGAGGLTKFGAGTLTLTASNAYTGPTTIGAGILQMGVSGTGATLTIANASFETPAIGAPGYQYNPSGASWTFMPSGASGGSGIGSSPTFYVTAPPSGTQAAFLQTSGSFFQSITTATAGFYQITFQAQGRGGASGPDGVLVQVNGVTSGSWAATDISQSQWLTYSSVAYLTSGTHTLAFVGNNTLGGDRSTSIDNVQAFQPTTTQGRLPSTTAVTLSASGATLDLFGTVQTIGSLSGVAGSSVAKGYLTTGGDGTSTTFAGALSTVNLTKVGSGTLTLSGSNFLLDATTVSAGVLQIGGGGTTGSINATSPVSIAGGAALAFNRSDALTYGGTVSGAGGLVKLGSGTLTITASNAYAGTTTLTAGALALGNAGALGPSGTISFGGGALQFSASNTTDYSARFSTAAGQAYALDTNGQNVTLATALVSSGGSLAKAGGGTLTLTAANTYAGATTISGGVLQVGSGSTTGAIADASPVSVASGAALAFNRSDAVAYGGTVSGSGGLTQLGGGTLTILGTSSYTGVTTFAGGVIEVSALTNYGVAGPLGARASGQDVATNIGLLFRGGTLRFSGTTAQSTNRAIRVSTAGGATIDASGSVPEATLSFTATSSPDFFENGGVRTVTFTGGHTGTNTFAMQIVEAGGATSVVKSGSGRWVFTGTNTYSGATTISGGTLQIGAGGTTGSLSASTAVTNNAALVFNRSDALTVANTISGSGLVVQQGTGSLGLSGANTHSGGTRLASSGTLVINNASALGTGGLTVDGGALDTGGVSTGYGTVSLVNAAATPQTWNANLTYVGTTLPANLGSGTVTLTGNRTVTVPNRTLAVGGIAGGFALEKTGTGTLVLQGAGSQAGTTVTAGTLRAEAAGALGTGVVSVASGATLALGSLNQSAAGLSGAGSVVGWTPGVTTPQDGASLVNAGKNYTQLLDFGDGTAATINGVAFTTAATTGTGFTLAGATSLYPQSGTPTGYGQLMSDFYYNGNPGTLTFTGLTAGTAYEAVLYTQIGAWVNRVQNATFTTGTFVQTVNGLDEGAVGAVVYGFVAQGPSASIQMAPAAAATFHWFAASLEQVGAQTLTVGDAGTYDFSGVISGRTGLTKIGAGTQTLTGTNTYTGATTVSAGMLQVGSGGTTGSITDASPVSVSGGATLAFNRSDAVTYGGVVSGSGGLAKLGGGTLTLSASNTYTGPTTVSAGVLQVGSGGATGAIADAGGVSLAAGSTLVFNRSDSLAYGGVVTGSGGLTKLGAGSLTLSAASSYTGTTSVAAGTLVVTGSLAAPATVAPDAVLSGTGRLGAVTVANAGILTPGVDGVGTLTLSSLAFSGSGTVNVGVENYAPASLLQVNGGVTTAGGSTSVTFALGQRLATVNSGTYALLSYTGSQLGDASAFVVSGSTGARQAVSLANGTQAVNLVVGNAFPIWSGTAGSGWSTTDNWVLDTTGSATSFLAADAVVFDDSAATGAVTLSQAVNPVTTTFSGTTLAYTLSSAGDFGITSGNLVKSGPATLTITTSNAFNGGTTLSAGTLRIGNDAALGTGAVTVVGGTITSDSASARVLANAFTFAGDATLGSATDSGALTISGTVDLGGVTRTMATPSNVTLAGVLANGGLVKTGVGTLTLGNVTNTYAGGTVVNGGTLALGSGTSDGNIRGSLTINAGGTVVASGSGWSLGYGGTRSGATYSGTSVTSITINGGVLAFTGESSGAGVAATSIVLTGGTIGGASFGWINTNTLTPTLQTLASASRSTLSGGISLRLSSVGALTFDVAGGTTTDGVDLLVSGSITDATAPATDNLGGTVVKAGAGTLVLAANNTYVGSTTVTGGTLQVGAGGTTGSLNAASAIVNHATLVFNRSNALTVANTISGSGVVVQQGSGNFTLSGANTFSGGTRVAASSGTFAINNASALGTGRLTLEGNALDTAGVTAFWNATPFTVSLVNAATTPQTWNGNVTYAGTTMPTNLGTGTVTLTGNRTVTVARSSFAVGGIAGGFTIEKSGTGTLVLQGAGVQAGTTVSAGTLRAEAVGVLGSGGLTVASGATFAMGSLNQTAGGLSGAGSVVGWTPGVTLPQDGSSLVSASKNYVRLLDFGNGAGATVNGVAFTTSGTSGTGFTLTGATTLFGESGSTAGYAQLMNDFYYGGNPGTLTFTGLSAGTAYEAVVYTQVGAWAGRPQNATFTNGTDVQTLSSVEEGAVGAIVYGFVAQGGTASIRMAPTGAGTFHWFGASLEQVGGQTLTVGDTGSYDFSGVISGGRTALAKVGSGTQTLSGANSYAGGTTISAGRLVVANDSALGSTTAPLAVHGGTLDLNGRSLTVGVLSGSAGGVIESGAGPVTLTTAAPASGTFAGVIQDGAGTVALVKDGAGTLTLSGSNGYTGSTTISTGTLALSGAGWIAASSAVVLSSSGATLDISAATGARTVRDLSGAAGSLVSLGGNTLTTLMADDSTTVFDGVIGGSGGFTKGGSATSGLTLTSIQQFTGPATIAAGALVLTGSNLLQNAARIDVLEDASLNAVAAGLRVSGSQTLGGYGTIYGDLTFAPGSVLSPGGSVGQLDGNFGAATLSGGMTYVFEVNDATGTAGGPVGWDLFQTDGAITLDGAATTPIVLDLRSLDGAVSGTAANFDPTYNYAWKFLVAGNGEPITYSPGWFTVTDNFQNASAGEFFVARGDQVTNLPNFSGGNSNELYVVYAAAPEPGSLVLAGAGVVCAGWILRRRARLTVRRRRGEPTADPLPATGRG